ncbi:beta-ketoacyl-ACP synthase II [Crossiella sp. CA-258035]|uniref:beta-ketoacyl-ACP synthase II n=1 Tax=Crossiella sp. CA-258035 TaxID=2981138 RepID=UPI0024BCB566|nr:beta-ketoacyl-ACP synthase II [Crossiella sp. CA-258035]WHT18320.1 beta-ketoacyl-ACP synthase II [Crossiella sp. CA-258035]
MSVEEFRKRRPRVVVTGWGAISPVGLTAEDTWAAFMAGRSGIARITTFDAEPFPTQIAGEVKGFVAEDHMPRKLSRRMDLFAQYGVAASIQAVESAKLTIDSELAPRTGVLLGTGYGAMKYMQDSVKLLQEKGGRAVGAYQAITGAHDSPTGEVSLMFGAAGPTLAISAACATGTDAIGTATRWIQYGEADVVIAGGTEMSVTPLDIASSSNARALSRRNDDPERASRPFDAERDGFIMAAGAGVVVLESLDHALRRGAPILAEVAGYAATSDAHHWTAPHPEAAGAVRAMSRALADAGITPEQIDYINAHGTSTELNDKTETFAIRQVLGEHATKIPVSSTKSMTGHMIGAAGAVELIACGFAMRTGIVPPTMNLHQPLDAEMNFVANAPQEHEVRYAMSNSFGFGGHNAVLVAKRWDG